MKQRADGRWRKSVTINGKQTYFYSTAKTEKAAVRDIDSQMLVYTQKKEKGKTFRQVAEEWQETHEKEVSASTSKRYKPCINRAIDRFGNDYIKQLTIADINNYIVQFSKKYTALKTVKMQKSVIDLIFKYAVINGYVSSNPCQYIALPKNLTQKKRELPEAAEIEKVQNGINCTFGLFAYLILYTGMRRGEALALKHGDIDRKNKVIHVTKSLIHTSNKPTLRPPKTDAGTRDIILLDCLADKLPKGKADELLFGNEKNEYLHQSNFNRLWNKYQQESGVSITPHQLRHAYATILYEAGVADKDAQELMGHSSIALTREIYTHISNKRKAETANKLNAFVSLTGSEKGQTPYNS